MRLSAKLDGPDGSVNFLIEAKARAQQISAAAACAVDEMP